MKLVILAAGLGSRYGGLKQLDPVTDNNEFIIDFSCFDAYRAGFDEVIFVIKKENLEIFSETIGSRVSKKIKVTYAFQDISMLPAGCTLPEERAKPWGTAHAVLCAKEAVGNDSFVVINADDFYGGEAFRNVAGFLKDHTDQAGSFCMAGFKLKNTLTENGTVSRGICRIGESGDLLDVTERTRIIRDTESGRIVYLDSGKPTGIPEDSLVSMNFWGFTPKFFDRLESDFADFINSLPEERKLSAEFYIPYAVTLLLERHECSVSVLPVHSRWFGVTYPDDKKNVVDNIGKMIKDGEYPASLWEAR